jgi:hypothetical protein
MKKVEGNADTATPDTLIYRLTGAALGAAIGVLIDVVQRQELCAAVIISRIFAMHLQIPAPPIVYVATILLLGFAFSIFYEKHSAHKTLLLAAGFASLLQNGVPASLPNTMPDADATSGISKDVAFFLQISGPTPAKSIYIAAPENSQIGEISLRFDFWSWPEGKWQSYFARLSVNKSWVVIDLKQLLFFEPSVYYVTIEVPGYKIVTEHFTFEPLLNEPEYGMLHVRLDPTFVPLFIQRLFITPPTKREMSRKRPL